MIFSGKNVGNLKKEIFLEKKRREFKKESFLTKNVGNLKRHFFSKKIDLNFFIFLQK